MRRTGRWPLLGILGLLVGVTWGYGTAAQVPQVAAKAEVTNRSGFAISDLRMASRVTTGWGDNLLAAEIKPGEKRWVTPARQEGCIYAIRVIYRDSRFERFAWIDLCHGNGLDLAARTAQQIGSQDTYHSPPGATVRIDNRSTRAIRSVRVAPEGRQIGLDRLGGQPIPPGKSRDVQLDAGAGCLYRIRAIYDDNMSEVVHSADLCRDHIVVLNRAAVLNSTQVPANMRSPARAVVVFNQSGVRLDWVYVYPPGKRSTLDRLGTDVIWPGRNFRIDVSDHAVCLVTVEAVFTDRRSELIEQFDLCAADEPEVRVRGPNSGSGPGPGPGPGPSRN